jgi:hypothetical protein
MEISNKKVKNMKWLNKVLLWLSKREIKMKINKNNYGSFVAEVEAQDQPSYKKTFGRLDYDLYKEEKDISFPVYQVKYFCISGEEKWKVIKNNDILFVIEGERLSEKEKSFLRSSSGVCAVINMCKKGIATTEKAIEELRKILE